MVSAFADVTVLICQPWTSMNAQQAAEAHPSFARVQAALRRGLSCSSFCLPCLTGTAFSSCLDRVWPVKLNPGHRLSGAKFVARKSRLLNALNGRFRESEISRHSSRPKQAITNLPILRVGGSAYLIHANAVLASSGRGEPYETRVYLRPLTLSCCCSASSCNRGTASLHGPSSRQIERAMAASAASASRPWILQQKRS